MKNTTLSSMRYRGIVLVLLAAFLWGTCGTVTQFLFHVQGLSPEWLVTIRMLSAGTLLLLPSARYNIREIFDIWRSAISRRQLLIFSILGMMLMQYSYFVAIQVSNAATATILQYLAPAMIAVYSTIRTHRLPTRIETLAITLAIVGTFFLVTKGDIHTLVLSPIALAWGLFCGLTLAFYTVYPSFYLIRWPSNLLLGWSMLLGGITMIPIGQPWHFVGEPTLLSLAGIIYVVIFGTIIPFYAFLESIKYVSPQTASTLASTEALVVVLLSITLLALPFTVFDWLGTACIISTVILLAGQPSRKS